MEDYCIKEGDDTCKGDIVYIENINTGKYHAYCHSHSLRAIAIQDAIHHDYLNATVREEE